MGAAPDAFVTLGADLAADALGTLRDRDVVIARDGIPAASSRRAKCSRGSSEDSGRPRFIAAARVVIHANASSLTASRPAGVRASKP